MKLLEVYFILFCLFFSATTFSFGYLPPQRMLQASKDCKVHGCQQCDQSGQFCQQCTLQLVLIKGRCLCSNPYTKPNQEDLLCQKCEIAGCEFCLKDNPTACAQCLDERAIYHNDNKTCSCPEAQYFNLEGFCTQIRILGCIQYEDNCLTCISGLQKTMEGSCRCQSRYERVDFGGSCRSCLVLGCASCEFGDHHLCRWCLDPLATLSEDRKTCTCPDGRFLGESGFCDGCEDFACSVCSEGRCERCTDPIAVLDIQGQCQCNETFWGMNKFGMCNLCNVSGCSVCEGESCAICEDPTATIHNGSCVCPDKLFMDEQGMCSFCQVPGCRDCRPSDPFFCDRCEDGLIKHDNGYCDCENAGQKFSDRGICESCSVLGCQSCLSNNSNSCSKCHKELLLIDQACYCQQDSLAINQEMKCSECLVVGCVSCDKDNSAACLSCAGTFKLENATCICLNKGQTVSNQGSCHNCMQKWTNDDDMCQIRGCAECSDPYICAKCGAFMNVVGVICECYTEQFKINRNGKCEFCPIQGCEYCEVNNPSKCECWEGTDENCSVGYYQNIAGRCLQCQTEGCEVCTSNGTVCEDCGSDKKLIKRQCVCLYENFVLERGVCTCIPGTRKISQRCVSCKIPECQQCYSGESGEQICEECSDGWLLELINGITECLKPSSLSCLVKDCLYCKSDDPLFCLQCEDNFVQYHGYCQCGSLSEKKNQLELCSQCNVPGCASCDQVNPNVCIQCESCEAFLIEGQCLCSYQFPNLNSTLYQCPTHKQAGDWIAPFASQPNNCTTSNCSLCQEGQYYESQFSLCVKCFWKCQTCSQPNRCIDCKQGYRYYGEGLCFQCEVRFCAVCEQQICLSCKEGFLLKDNSCKHSDEDLQDILDILYPTFEQYIQMYKKSYSDEQQYEERKRIYEAKIESFQDRQDAGYQLGVNKFTDWTQQERKRHLGTFKVEGIPEPKKVGRRFNAVSRIMSDTFPESLDWRKKEAVTKVKDQGDCASSWAFGVIACVQSTLIIIDKADKSIDLSEQFLLECTENSDCEGTLSLRSAMQRALTGVPTERKYPYDPLSSNPAICDAKQRKYQFERYYEYNNIEDEELIRLLQKGPVVVTELMINDWQDYESGILRCEYDEFGGTSSHTALLVGYSNEYWLVKNQWGRDWGEGGYIRVSRERYNYRNCRIGRKVYAFKFELSCSVGCMKCGPFNACLQCAPGSILVQGRCECQIQGFVFNQQQQCVPCAVPGCIKCSLTDFHVCELCGPNMTINNGKCTCNNPYHKISPFGACEQCMIEGCQSCFQGQCTKCNECDELLLLGLCFCKTNFTRNKEGKCTWCPRQHCYECQDKLTFDAECRNCVENREWNGKECVCQDEFVEDELDFCRCKDVCNGCGLPNCVKCRSKFTTQVCLQCKPRYQFDYDFSSPCCEVLGCQNCTTHDKCTVCIDDDARLVDDKCICKNSTHRINFYGECERCEVEGCLSCEKKQPLVCRMCEEGGTLEEGQCLFYGEPVNAGVIVGMSIIGLMLLAFIIVVVARKVKEKKRKSEERKKTKTSLKRQQIQSDERMRLP